MVCMAVLLFVTAVRLYTVLSAERKVLPENDLSALEKRTEDPYEAVIVLGAGVYMDGTPSPMLRFRLEKTIEIYETGAVKSVFVSGDHREGEYDEVDHMVEYLIVHGVPEERIWYDYEGHSTYESMQRAAEAYDIRHAVLVTQQYHLYRAMMIGRFHRMEIVGAPAENWKISAGTVLRTLREWPACVKDLYYCIVKKEAGT